MENSKKRQLLADYYKKLPDSVVESTTFIPETSFEDLIQNESLENLIANFKDSNSKIKNLSSTIKRLSYSNYSKFTNATEAVCKVIA
jgi:hypothetical protein